MDRLSRNLDDLHALVQGLSQRSPRRVLQKSLFFTGEDAPMGNFMLYVTGAFTEFERSLIREREQEGIALRAGAGVQEVVLARDYGIN